MRALRLASALVTSLMIVGCGSSTPPPRTGGAGTGGTGTGGSGTGGTGTGGSGTGGSGTGGLGTGGGPAGSGGTGGAAGTGVTGGNGGHASGGASGSAGGGAAGHTPDGGTGKMDAATDHVPDAGTTGCAGLLCEDFETGAIDPAKWDLVASGGTLVVQQQQVAHGRYAAQVHATSGPSDDWALLVAKNVPAALKGTTTFGRVNFYAVSAATNSIHVQMTFAGHNGTGTATGPAPFTKLRYMEVASNSARWQLGFDLLDISPLVEEVSYSTAHMPTGKWVCLEWKFEDQPDRITVWVDGTQTSTFDDTNVAYASPGPVPKPGDPLYDGKSAGLIGGFDTFGFGFHDWHPKNTFDIYYDDLVLDAKRVGCSP